MFDFEEVFSDISKLYEVMKLAAGTHVQKNKADSSVCPLLGSNLRYFMARAG